MKELFKNKKVIIFDLDGTLIDSIGIWNKVDVLVVKRLTNIDVEEASISKMRDAILKKSKSKDIYLEYCEFLRNKFEIEMSAEELLKFRWEISDKFIKGEVDYKPFAEQVLWFLKNKGFRMALATTTTDIQINAYRNFNQNIIQKANLDDIFEIILTKDNVQKKKPNPEVHEKILSALNVKPQECLIVEDSLLGVQAANNIGIDVIAMHDTYADKDRKLINELSDIQFQDFREMLDYIREEFGE
ncbi:MAG: HAD family phosphatase [Bacilli bacterium]|nr:HAD family phosphatase [Bacilli bacterium]